MKTSLVQRRTLLRTMSSNSRTQTMKPPTSSESGYFSLRISAASLLCICGVWLAAMSFAPSAVAWNIKYAGSPGYVTWASANAPAIEEVQERKAAGVQAGDQAERKFALRLLLWRERRFPPPPL